MHEKGEHPRITEDWLLENLPEGWTYDCQLFGESGFVISSNGKPGDLFVPLALLAEQRRNTQSHPASSLRYTEPIPEYGDLMTREQWLSGVRDGAFIDYDGWGNPSDGQRISRLSIIPSRASELPDTATHVVWYNK